MKKVNLYMFCFILLSSSILLIGCSSNLKDSTSNRSDSSSNSATGDQVFTLDDLKTYDGQNGNPAYVAIDGIVYDVTNAKNWNEGKHQNGVVAGQDLTSVLKDSPHGDKVLKDLPVVGTLE